jgi:hypothetical protein
MSDEEFIIMDHIEGCSLDMVWDGLSAREKGGQAADLKAHMDCLRRIPPEQYIGGIGRKPVPEFALDDADRRGPFESESDFKSALIRRTLRITCRLLCVGCWAPTVTKLSSVMPIFVLQTSWYIMVVSPGFWIGNMPDGILSIGNTAKRWTQCYGKMIEEICWRNLMSLLLRGRCLFYAKKSNILGSWLCIFTSLFLS